MVNAGLNVNAIYERLGYNAEDLPLREMRTPHQLQAYFWETVEAVTVDPEIGLHLCPHLPVFHGELLDYLLFSISTLAVCLHRALKYLRLLSFPLIVLFFTHPPFPLSLFPLPPSYSPPFLPPL